ncbi:uncharacterized protein LOC126845957 [Adelges cooleyi]|uniref:uncharacterized protein LOC126845957 n=1 Tax=Adelges cooleyi TaxID=133065 RepID=UPI00217F68B5|nr:uncharacterized protein LOC126845957 [Adelges cooleyi]
MKLQFFFCLVLLILATQAKSEVSEPEKIFDNLLHSALDLTRSLSAFVRQPIKQYGLDKNIEGFLEKVQEYYFDHGDEIFVPIDSALTKFSHKLTAEQKRFVNDFFAYFELIKDQLQNLITKNKDGAINTPYNLLPENVKEIVQKAGREVEQLLKTFKEKVESYHKENKNN